jgi:circadian clock protein KaiC
MGTACLLTGPDGTGKTSLATLYLHAAARRGQRSVAYLFDERPGTFFTRAESLGMNLRPFVENGLVQVRTIHTGEISPGEFAHRVRRDVEEEGAELVLLDSLSGYVNAMPQEGLLMIHLQELLSFLNRHEVLTFLIVSESGIVGSVQHKEVEIGYMADTVVLLRHFEAGGAIRQAISAVKRRHGQHERTIRQLQISPEGIRVGPAITDFTGVLQGTPAFEGDPDLLLTEGGSEGSPSDRDSDAS